MQQNALTDNRALFLPEPRLGLAWNVFGDGSTSITAGAGLHHSLLDALDYRLDQAAPFNTVYSYSSTTVANPTSSTPLVSPSTVASNMSTPALLSYNLKVEQRLAPATSLSLSYSGSHSYHQILNGDLNEPAFTTMADGTIYYPTTTKANPAVANTTSWWSGGSGNYNAFIADFRHDSLASLSTPSELHLVEKPRRTAPHGIPLSLQTRPRSLKFRRFLISDYGPAATDVRHIVAINGTYVLPVGRGEALFGDATGSRTVQSPAGRFQPSPSLFTGFPLLASAWLQPNRLWRLTQPGASEP